LVPDDAQWLRMTIVTVSTTRLGTAIAADSFKEDCTMTTDRQTLVKLIQDSIDKGATSVEEIHKTIGDLPLKILEGNELLKGPAKEVRHVRDHTIGAMYDLIRKVNEEVGTLASELLAEAAKQRVARRAAQHAARREITSIRGKSRNAKSQRHQGAKQGSAGRQERGVR
jgi:hypothetical protein